MRRSTSSFHRIRGLRYHLRVWGTDEQPLLVLLHGWMDVSASFQFLADALPRWRLVAPDWRGFGRTAWSAGPYWFPDYLADLDALADILASGDKLRLVGHSLGGNVSCLYAGVRPQRIAGVVSLEGFGVRRSLAGEASVRYGRWLDELREAPRLRDYASFAELAQRLQASNPRLTARKAGFLARHWGRKTRERRVALRADPMHKAVNPVLYRLEEAMACWSRIDAPVLWVRGEHSDLAGFLRENDAEFALRKRCFRRLTESTVAGAGHMMHHDQPEAVAALIDKFFTGSHT